MTINRPENGINRSIFSISRSKNSLSPFKTKRHRPTIIRPGNIPFRFNLYRHTIQTSQQHASSIRVLDQPLPDLPHHNLQSLVTPELILRRSRYLPGILQHEQKHRVIISHAILAPGTTHRRVYRSQDHAARIPQPLFQMLFLHHHHELISTDQLHQLTAILLVLT